MGLSMIVQGGTLSGISSKTSETLMTENTNASTENINPPKQIQRVRLQTTQQEMKIKATSQVQTALLTQTASSM